SWLLPRAMRPHVAAVYAFARVADDIADEGTAPAADRLARLEAWQQRLHAAVAASEHGFNAASPAAEDLMMMALAHSIRTLDLPRDVVVACRAREMELEGPWLTESWMAALAQCVAKTRVCFEAGRDVCDAVRGRLRYELRFTWLGGTRMLELVDRTGAALLNR